MDVTCCWIAAADPMFFRAFPTLWAPFVTREAVCNILTVSVSECSEKWIKMSVKMCNV